MKSRMREICTYGSVRGDRLPLTSEEREVVVESSTRLIIMGDISFEMLYQKSLKIKPLIDNIETDSFHIRNLRPKEQIGYLKQLGNIKVDKEDSKIGKIMGVYIP